MQTDTDVNSAHKNLLKAIVEKIPQREVLIKTLMDILFLGKEAIYRRLRGEVSFTLSEAEIISRKLNISLDSVLAESSLQSRPFQLKLIDFLNPAEQDLFMKNEFLDFFVKMKNSTYSELGCSTNTLPQPLYLTKEYITKFHMLKWVYQYGISGSKMSFDDIVISEKTMTLYKEYVKETMNVKNSFYILDDMVFCYLINDIKYFLKINLLQEKHVQLLKKELIEILRYIEALAIKGKYENGNKILFYISNINIESNHSYLENVQNQNVSIVRTFTMNPIVSFDNETFNVFKKRVQSLRKSSTLITQSGEVHRISFFNKQYEIVDTL